MDFRRSFFKKAPIIIISVFLVLSVFSCKKEAWKPGMLLAKESLKIGVVHITDPFSESSGYAFSHEMGIKEMKRNLGLEDGQVRYKIHVSDADSLHIESAMRELIAQGAVIIFATSWGYMDSCEKLAKEFPSVVFAHASGNKYNDTNFTNYFGRVYEACYLAGIAAGAQTRFDKIGFVAAWGKENSEVSGNLNAFALGVEKVNPQARIYVKITNSWYDPMGEAQAARALVAAGCDVIAQHCDTPNPQLEVEKAGVWGIGYNTDMSIDAPAAVITSVLWNWGAYYTAFVQSVLDGTVTTDPYYGSLKDGIVNLAPISGIFSGSPETLGILDAERLRLESGAFNVFSGILKTNEGRDLGKTGESLPDSEIRSGINWYYHTVIEL